VPVRPFVVFLGVAGTIAAIAAAAPASPARLSRADCTPGVTTYGSTNARVFCGPAKATVRIGGKTLKFKGGSCERTSKYLSINIGTVVLGTTTKKKPDYFGLDVGAYPGSTAKPAGHDGTYSGGVIAIDFGGKSYLLRGDTAKITLSGGRTKGTFSAGGLLGSSGGTGTFSC
jgi:hypothetical protein